MHFHVEPGFSHSETEPRYYVCPLTCGDGGWKRGYQWQIQFLNEAGQGGASLEFGPADGSAFWRYLPLDLPKAALEAARRGVSDYVDQNGTPITFSGRRQKHHG